MSESKTISKEEIDLFRESFSRLESEISKTVIGHKELTEDMIVCLIAKGHALIEGVPGLGKTHLINSLSQVLGLKASRIQFTPDLMPADIIGTNVLMKDDNGNNTISFSKGPIFSQVVLADEINRATPKTQSALLEAMQEQQVTVSGKTHQLEGPFIVLATQNPIEMEGTYPLPEAQLDRFFFKLKVQYPSRKELLQIVDLTTSAQKVKLQTIVKKELVEQMQMLIRHVPVPMEVKEYALSILEATHPEQKKGDFSHYIRYGSSPRGIQSMILSSKVYALNAGRYNVSFEDIRRAAFPSLRHRIILSFEGEAQNITPDQVIGDILESLKES